MHYFTSKIRSSQVAIDIHWQKHNASVRFIIKISMCVCWNTRETMIIIENRFFSLTCLNICISVQLNSVYLEIPIDFLAFVAQQNCITIIAMSTNLCLFSVLGVTYMMKLKKVYTSVSASTMLEKVEVCLPFSCKNKLFHMSI